MSESDSYPKAEFFRKPNLSKNSPNGPKCGLNTRHDNREVTWSDSYIQFFRKPNLSEYLPNVPKCGLNTRHDNREVTWSDSYIQFFRKPNLSEYLPNVSKCVRSVDWTHDIIIVKWHLFIYSFDTSANFALWQMRHRFNPRIRVNDYQRYSMLTVLPLRSMSCTLGNSSSL